MSNENYFNKLQEEFCQLGYWELDYANSRSFFSPKLLSILGIDNCEAGLDEVFETIDVKHRNVLIEALHKLRAEGRNFDLTLRLKGDSETWIRLTGKKGEEAGVLVGLIQSATHEVLLDRNFRNKNLELSAFEKGLEQFSIVARTDRHGRITYANEEFLRLSKYKFEELIGKDHRIVNSGHHPKAFFTTMWETISQGKNWRGEVKNKAKDGMFYWVDTIIIPIADCDGAVTEFLSFRHDITQKKGLEIELDLLKQEIARLRAAL